MNGADPVVKSRAGRQLVLVCASSAGGKVRWSEIRARQPALGAVTDRLLIEPGVLLAGTTRRDGTARISGVEPLVLDGDLWLSMMSGSAKARDLARDPRVVLNSVITSPSPPAEIKVRGTVRAVTDRDRQERYAASVREQIGWQPVAGQFTLLIVEVADVTYIGSEAGTGAQHVARWPSGEEYVRPQLTPTSLGPRQAVSRLLIRE
jgi:general stress protein 26